MNVNIIVALALVSVLFMACNNSSDKTTSENMGDSTFMIPDSLMEETIAPQDNESVNGIIHHLSSPVEMSALLKEEGIGFNYKFMSPAENADEFITSFKQALNLGVLGADMGYLNMYNKKGAVINYITAIKELSDELKVGQFFNFRTLKRLATNNENIDSLMYMSVISFDKMDTYLIENKRSNISALLVTGVWIEGVYIAAQVVKDNDNLKIKERIAEQKIALEQLLIVLDQFKEDKNFAGLIYKLEKIESDLSEINIIEEDGDAEMKEVDGVLMAVSNTTVVVEMTDEQLDNIIASIEEVRNYIIEI